MERCRSKVAGNGLGLCDALAFEKLSLNLEMKMNRIISAENLHVSKGIAKPMLSACAECICSIASLKNKSLV